MLGCIYATSKNDLVTADVVAINAIGLITCIKTISVVLSPDVTCQQNAPIDLIYSVLDKFTLSDLPIDNAAVTWAAGGTSKSTSDGSVITFGNTLVVQLAPADVATVGAHTYTATITTSDAHVYMMTGTLTVVEVIGIIYELFGMLPQTQFEMYGTLPNAQPRMFGMPQSEVRLVGMPEEQQRSGFGTLTIKKPRVFGRRSPDTQLVGTIQEQERSGLGILTTTNPRMLGTQPKTNVRLFGMLQEIDKN